jgi:hypothetical protein
MQLSVRAWRDWIGDKQPADRLMNRCVTNATSCLARSREWARQKERKLFAINIQLMAAHKATAAGHHRHNNREAIYNSAILG